MGRYLAGLWDSELIVGILWRIDRQLEARPSPCIAPTWSWASTNKPVLYYFDLDVKLIEESYKFTTRPIGTDKRGPTPLACVSDIDCQRRGSAAVAAGWKDNLKIYYSKNASRKASSKKVWDTAQEFGPEIQGKITI